jgi:mRNA-degrading endonuclease YafQ of YafQ-DinJ toxin-antitoxin module
MQIFYSPEFIRRYRKLPNSLKDLAEKKEDIFRNDPFDASLKTYKLHGRFGEFWAFSVDYNCRIIFKFEQNNKIRFYSIGGHSIYK